jgi:predicted transcriptional regulator
VQKAVRKNPFFDLPRLQQLGAERISPSKLKKRIAEAAGGSTRRYFVISIKPEFAEMILDRSKKIEFRRTKPSFGPGDRGLIYASAPSQRIVGAFEVGAVHAAAPATLWRRVGGTTPHKRRDILRYFEGASDAYGIEIATVRRTKPRSLPKEMHPTQQWQFLDPTKPTHQTLIRAASRTL